MGWLAWVGIIVSIQAAASVVALALLSIDRRDDEEPSDRRDSDGPRRHGNFHPQRDRRSVSRPSAHSAGKRGRFA
jgi:hypothetical protein